MVYTWYIPTIYLVGVPDDDKERISWEDVGGLQEIAYKVTRASF